MNKINFSNWKEFRVGDIFAATRGTSRKMQTLSPGNVPIIAAARYNQGIAGFYDVEDEYENAITISCNGVGCGSTFYHDYPFAITGDAIVLVAKEEIPTDAMWFLACVFDKHFNSKYSYEEKCSADKAEAEYIRLPSTNDGTPDWEYMGNYMKSIEQKANDKLSKLYSIVNTPPILMKTVEWSEFNVSDLFAVQKGTMILSNCNLCDDGKVPVYSSTTDNNGIVGYTNIKPTFIVSDDVPFYLIFGDHTKSMFIAKNDFNIMDNVKVLRPSVYNEYAIRFITTAWSASIPNIGYARHWSLAKKTPILLPEKNGQPDWQYMEEYMRAIETMVEQKMRLLA